MTITLITGGNKGLGLETARALVQQGHKVYIGSRDLARGKAAAESVSATCIQLDVTDESSVSRAAGTIKAAEGYLDVLVNNAGISGGFKRPGQMTASDVEHVYQTNVFGIVRMMQHFLPLLEASQHAVVVNVSSGLGSFDMVTNPATEESHVNSLAYCSSKSAVTMLTVQYAKGLPQIKINAADPGSTNTDLVGDFSNNAKPASQGIIPIVKLATIDKDGPTGTFIDGNGVVPW